MIVCAASMLTCDINNLHIIAWHRVPYKTHMIVCQCEEGQAAAQF